MHTSFNTTVRIPPLSFFGEEGSSETTNTIILNLIMLFYILHTTLLFTAQQCCHPVVGKVPTKIEQSPCSRECQKDVIKFEKNKGTLYTVNGRGVETKLLIPHFVHVNILPEK